jgi:hypothetical protein
MRFEVDLDVLVPPERFESVLIELQARGWKLIDQNWRLAAEVLPAELRLLSANGDLLDLHWHLLSEAGLRKQFTIPTTSLLARRRELGSGMPVLNAVDQLVHLGIHGALSGANRLSWLLDAGLAARHVQSWNDVAVATRSAGAGPALGLVLARARRELGTPAPPKALRQMGAGLGWRTATAAIDALSPLRISPDDPALARSWARSARRSALSSFAEFTGHAVGWATSGAPQRRAASPLKDPADPRSPLYPAADPVAREAYFSAVASAETSSEIA